MASAYKPRQTLQASYKSKIGGRLTKGPPCEGRYTLPLQTEFQRAISISPENTGRSCLDLPHLASIGYFTTFTGHTMHCRPSWWKPRASTPSTACTLQSRLCGVSVCIIRMFSMCICLLRICMSSSRRPKMSTYTHPVDGSNAISCCIPDGGSKETISRHKLFKQTTSNDTSVHLPNANHAHSSH